MKQGNNRTGSSSWWGSVVSYLLTWWVTRIDRVHRDEIVARLLRKWPFWAMGHRIDCEAALLARNHARAFGAASAALMLSDGEKARAEAQHLLGRVYLASHSPERAFEVLSPLHTVLGEDPSLAEDVAAAAMACGAWKCAVSAIERVPETARSQSLRVVLERCRKKVQEIG